MTTAARPMGIVHDMPFQDYLAVDAMSVSGMRHLARSPFHFKHRAPMVATRPMLRGTLAHCAQLEPHAMASRYIVVPEDAPRRPSKAQWAAKSPSPDSVAAMEWWKQFNSSAVGLEIVTPEEYQITEAQLEAIKAEPELAAAFARGHSEVSLFWVDKDSGVYCKARPDHIAPTNGGRVKLLDLKAVADDSPIGFARGLSRLGYHRQQAHYMAGAAACGLAVDEFVFAAVSSVPPVLAVPYRLVQEAVDQGEEECAELLALYAQCVEKNHWPAYSPAECMVDLERWAKRSQELEVSYVD